MTADDALPLLLDVDTGVDDAIAIALAVRSPAVDLVGVTTVAGNVTIDKTTENSLRVLAWLGAESVPVAAGMAAPLVRTLRDAAHFHAESGLGLFAPPSSPASVVDVTAPEFMIRRARERPGELTFVCLGPLTNLAVALGLEPELPALLRGIVIMGGAFTVRGNVTPAAEFNIYVDPEAAAIVARSRLAATFVGLDVTHQVALMRADWEQLAGRDTVEAKLVHEVCRYSFEQRAAEHFYLHDPLALAVAVKPELVEALRCAVAVDTGPTANAGETLIVEDPMRPAHAVARSVDTAGALAFINTTLRLT